MINEFNDAAVRAAFDAAPSAMTISDTDGCLLRVNRAFARLLGTTPDTLAGREIRAVTHSDDRDLHSVAIPDGQQLLRTRYLDAAGKPVPVVVRTCQVGQSGTATFRVSHVERDDAQAWYRMNGDVVSTISDEVLTPLTSVQGYLEMVAEGDFGALSAEQGRLIRIAMRNADRIGALVSDLLILARLDIAGVASSRPASADLRHVVQNALADVGPTVAESEQEVMLDLPWSPVQVAGDEVQLQRAVVSVLVNALAYNRDAGTVTIAVDADQGWARIRVTDTGLGVAAEEIPRIADRFYRGSSAQHRAIAGTGLGLAITKTIIEGHGGTLEIASEPGHGTQVVLSLPLASSRSVPQAT